MKEEKKPWYEHFQPERFVNFCLGVYFFAVFVYIVISAWK